MFNVPVLAAIMVLPEPLMDPPDQFNVPVTVTSPLPASAPLERLTVGNVTAELKFTVPPLTVSKEPPVNAPLNVATPLEKVLVPLRLTVPASLIVPPMTSRLPAPVIWELAIKVWVRFGRRVDPLATAKSLLCDPPPCKPSSPACTATEPLLLKVTVELLT